MPDAKSSSLTKAILIAAVLSLLVTVVRLVGQLQGWGGSLFNKEPGGGGSLLGITWLVMPFGFWFGRRLAKGGSRPASLGKSALFLLLGIGLVVGVFAYGIQAVPDWQERVLVLGVGSSIAGLCVLLAWPRAWLVLVAYGLLARLPVVLVQYLAVQNGWDTHFAKGPPDAPPELALTLLTVAQLSFWPLAFTPLVGGLFALLGARTVRS
jgi:hypothetical protein